MITCKDCIHSCVCPLADGQEYSDIFYIKSDCEYFEQGYRKQSEGEWIDSLKGYCQCSNCRTSFETLPTTFMFKLNNSFCRHCGAKMKDGYI
jgi:hypothetical protein